MSVEEVLGVSIRVPVSREQSERLINKTIWTKQVWQLLDAFAETGKVYGVQASLKTELKTLVQAAKKGEGRHARLGNPSIKPNILNGKKKVD